MKKKLHLRVPARLHMSVFDMNHFDLGICGGGGIGAAIDLYTEIIINKNFVDSFQGVSRELTKKVVKKLKKKFAINCGICISVNREYSSHIGLGSTGSLVLGIIYGIAKIMDMNLTNEEIIQIFIENIEEEHDNKITKCFETLVGPWSILKGGVVILNEESKIICKANISSEYHVLIILPKNKEFLENTMEEEIDLLDGLGKKYDLTEKNLKKELFQKLIANRYSERDFLFYINTLKNIGSKHAEIEYQFAKNRDYVFLEMLCRKKSVLCTGMSSIGPAFFLIDTKKEILQMKKEIDSLEQYNCILTTICNAPITGEITES